MAATVPLRRSLIVRPTAGMNTLQPPQAIPEGASPDMQNMQICQGVLRKRPGYGKYTTGTFPASYINGVYSAQETAGTRHLYAVTSAHLFRYNTGTKNWDQMTGTLTGSNGQLFAFEVSQNNLIFCQGVDPVQALPLTGTTFAALSADCPAAKYLARWNNRLYIAFTVEGGIQKPFRVRWSVSGDHTNWTGVGSGFNDLQDEVYQIRNIAKWMDTLAVYSERNVSLATKTGNALGPAQFQLVVKDIGLFSDFSLRPYNTLHFLIGSDNFYIFDGAKFNPILNENRDFVYLAMNAAVQENNFGTLNLECQEYLAFLATAGSTPNNSVWVYNWAWQASYPWQFANPLFTSACLHYTDSSTTIAGLVGTIAAQGWRIGGSQLTANFPVIILGGTDGKVYYLSTQFLSDDGTAIACRWTSKDYQAADIDPSLTNHMVAIRGVGFTYVDPGTPFTLNFSFSNDMGITWSGIYPITVGGVGANRVADAYLSQQWTGKRVRFKFENNTTNEYPQIIALYPELEELAQKIG